jgi:transcriptional regulator with XRE-family HTH domain
MDPEEIGKRIAAGRDRKRWKQAELAERIGVSERTVRYWESGTTHPRSSLTALEEVLDINLRDERAVDIPVVKDGREFTVRMRVPADLTEEGLLRAEAAARGAFDAVIAMESADSEPEGQ